MSFPTSGAYNKEVYDKLQEFSPSYLIVCKSIDIMDMEIKNLRQVITSCDRMTLYLINMTIKEEQCTAQLELSQL